MLLPYCLEEITSWGGSGFRAVSFFVRQVTLSTNFGKKHRSADPMVKTRSRSVLQIQAVA